MFRDMIICCSHFTVCDCTHNTFICLTINRMSGDKLLGLIINNLLFSSNAFPATSRAQEIQLPPDTDAFFKAFTKSFLMAYTSRPTVSMSYNLACFVKVTRWTCDPNVMSPGFRGSRFRSESRALTIGVTDCSMPDRPTLEETSTAMAMSGWHAGKVHKIFMSVHHHSPIVPGMIDYKAADFVSQCKILHTANHNGVTFSIHSWFGCHKVVHRS